MFRTQFRPQLAKQFDANKKSRGKVLSQHVNQGVAQAYAQLRKTDKNYGNYHRET
jgi:hypothetical protein